MPWDRRAAGQVVANATRTATKRFGNLADGEAVSERDKIGQLAMTGRGGDHCVDCVGFCNDL